MNLYLAFIWSISSVLAFAAMSLSIYAGDSALSFVTGMLFGLSLAQAGFTWLRVVLDR